MTPPTRRRWGAVLALVILLAVLWLRYGTVARRVVNDFWSPLVAGQEALTGHGASSSRFAKTKLELVRELEQLEAVRDAQAREHRQLELLRAENLELRSQLGLPRLPGWQLLTARITTRDPAAGGRRLVIGCGLAEGVYVGLAVTSRGYLLGRVVESTTHLAVVMTLADPECSVSARVEVGNQPAYGILHGLAAEQWRAQPHGLLMHLPRDLAYESDLLVETSAFSESIPAGIPIGTLCPSPAGTVSETVDSLYKNAWVKPAAFEQDFTTVTVWVPVPTTAIQSPPAP